MTPAESIAAEVAARYGVTCRPEAVQFIPRGVSGLPDPLAPVTRGESKRRFKAAHYGHAGTRDRAERLRLADEATGIRKVRPGIAAAVKRRSAARLSIAETRDATMRAMADRPLAEIAAALGMTELAVKQFAGRNGIVLAHSKSRHAKAMLRARQLQVAA